VTEADAALLQTLPDLSFQAVLAFARLGAAAMLLPGLGEVEVPAAVRFAIGLAVLALLLPVLAPALPPRPEEVVELARLVATEVVVGLWLGGLARVAVLALAMAGQAIAAMIGLSGLLVADPALGAQATSLGRAFGLAGAVLVLSTGLWALPLRALAESYAVLPAGDPFPAGAAAGAMAAAGAASLELALRLAAPFVVAGVVMNVALGLLARLTPQVQTFFVAVPGQILAGLALLALLAPPLLASFGEATQRAFLALPGAH
jgi:flagellar biosynthetic protein FliR